MKPSSAVILSLVVVMIAAVAIVIYPMALRPRAVNPKTIAISNVKQIGIATNIYASDYDDVLPAVQDQKTFKTLLAPYTLNPVIFKDDPDLQTHIVFNTHLSNVSYTAFSIPAEEIALTTPLAKSATAPIDHYVLGFVDSHAKGVDIKSWNADYIDRLDHNFPRVSQTFLPVAKP